MKVRPEPDSMPPQVGVGGGTPRPRNDRLGFGENDGTDAGGEQHDDRRHDVRAGYAATGCVWLEAPIDWAACTYMFSRTETTAERMMREPPMPSSRPSVPTRSAEAGPEHGNHHQQDNEIGKAHPGIDEALGNEIDLAAEIAGEDTDCRSR